MNPSSTSNGTTTTQNADGSFTLAAPGVAPGNAPQAFNSGQATLAPVSPVPQAQPASTTFNANQINGVNSGTGIAFPANTPSPATTAQTGASLNTSIPTPQSIISQEATPTPAEQTNTSLLSRIAGYIQGNKSLATLQTDQEA